jgi:hypothetical protein
MPFSLPNVPSMFKKNINIPIGREVFFKTKGGGSSIFNDSGFADLGGDSSSVHLIIEDSISLEFSTAYNEIIKPSGNVLGSLASTTFTWNGAGIGSGQFKQQGMKVWDSTEAITCSITANLYMKNSGYTDVYLPALFLVMQTLPSLKSGDSWGLIAPGPGLTSVFNMDAKLPFTEVLDGKDGFSVSEAIEAVTGGRLQFQEQGKGLFWMEIENYILLKECVITKVTPSWGDQLDEEGFPTKCQLSIDVTSINIATTNDVKGMLDYARLKRSGGGKGGSFK